jgi:hypothetical protein
MKLSIAVDQYVARKRIDFCRNKTEDESLRRRV